MATANYEYRRASGENVKVHFVDLFDDDEEEDHPITPQKHSRSSSSSSDSSLDSHVNEIDAHNVDSSDSKHIGIELPKSPFATEFGYPSPVWSFQGGSSLQSPATQLMNRPGYDPNRIPRSIFSSKPTNQMEWSVASNESLFSIHLGNNSFSRDHILAMNKSGELPRNDEFPSLPMMLPPVEEADHSKDDDRSRHSISTVTSEESIDVDNQTKQNEAVETYAETAPAVLRETEPDVLQETTLEDCRKESMETSHRSEKSTMSINSFQFPVLEVNGGRTSSSETDKQQMEEPLQSSSSKAEPAEEVPVPKAKQGGTNWFSCCSCFSLCG